MTKWTPMNIGGVPLFMRSNRKPGKAEVDAMDSLGEGFSKDDFIKLGTKIWQFCLRNGARPGQVDDQSVFFGLKEAEDDPDQESDPIFQFLDTMMRQHDGGITCCGLAQWIDCGLPQVEMGHKFAAALLCSDVTPEALEMVKMPWKSFFIEVPDGLLHIYDNTREKNVPIRRVMVCRIHNTHGEWAYMAWTSTSITLWRLGVPPAQLLPPVLEGQTVPEEILLEQTDEDRRVNSLLGRLVINTCLTMTMGGMLTEKRGPGHESWRRHKENPAKMEGHIRGFNLGRQVTVDLRDKVRDYISGHRNKVEVRTLVRGHFKRQHFGAGNAQVKIIFREPFWRGDEKLPMVPPRPHVIKADE